jgi:hypothetical protein
MNFSALFLKRDILRKAKCNKDEYLEKWKEIASKRIDEGEIKDDKGKLRGI